MKLYIDIEHLKSLANSRDNEVMKLIRENFDIYYTFDESDIKKEKRQKCLKIETWQKELSSGRNGKNFYYNSALPITDSFIETQDLKQFPKDDLQSVFFDKESHLLPKGLVSCKLGEELATLRNLLFNNKCIPAKIYYTRPEKNEDIHKWEIIAKNVSPCTDIIINDLYMFTQSDYEYESNSYKLIEELCKQSRGACINIVIITGKSYNMYEKKKLEDGTYNDESVEYQISTTTIIRNLKRITKKVTGHEAQITIIAQDKNPRNKRIHDRAIFTNYKMFLSGDSFKYYKEETKDDGKTTTTFESRGIWLGVCSLYDDEHMKIAKRFLKDVQDIIDESEMRIGSIIDGERKSNFLVFKT